MQTGNERGRVVSVRRVALPGDDASVWALCEAASSSNDLGDPRLGAPLDVVIGETEIGLVGEYVDGETLRNLLGVSMLTRRPLPTSVVLRVVVDVLEALSAAARLWERRLGSAEPVHACVMPDLILVPGFGDAMLIDVGLAGLLIEPLRLFDEAEFVSYTAPERLTGSRVADATAAVFSIGVVLWEMLTNRTLFGASSRVTTRMRVHGEADSAAGRRDAAREVAARVSAMPIPVSILARSLGKKFGVRLTSIAARALERDRKLRWPTPDDLAEQLRQLPVELATSAEVAAALHERMRHATEARKETLERLLTTGKASGSTPPDSKRDTLRPATE
jgi:serine/threonine protein kinase